tara:strand:- start:13589 stop:15103 length:1515 start_codon:yes stop_codon:yes gene_type:complete
MADLNSAFNKLMIISAGKYQADSERIEKDEQFNRRFRISELDRVSNFAPEINHYDYGDVINDPDAFKDYQNDVMHAYKSRRSGEEYVPNEGTLSPHAEDRLFTYGGYDLDYTPGLISYEDIDQYDAYLFGDQATGEALKIANRHNWGGLLKPIKDENSPYYGNVLLSEDEYLDLHEKKLVGNIPLTEDGFYALNTSDISELKKTYGYFKEGLAGATIRDAQGNIIQKNNIVGPGEVTKMIQEQNTLIREKDADLRGDPGWKNKFENTENWRKIAESAYSDKDEFGGMLKNKAHFSDKGLTVDVTNDSNKPQLMQETDFTIEEFKESFPNVYSLYFEGYQRFEDAYRFYTSAPQMDDQGVMYVGFNQQLAEELSYLPRIEKHFLQQVRDFEDINRQRINEGITVTQMGFMNDAKVMGYGRNTVLDDLQTLDPIIFNEVAIENLGPDAQNKLFNSLLSLEQKYIDQNDQYALEFLGMYTDSSLPITRATGIPMSKLLIELQGNPNE